MEMAFLLPILGQPFLHRVFVLDGPNQDGVPGVGGKRRERGMEHSAPLLELLRDTPPAFFPHVARHHEVRRAQLNPGVRTVASRGAPAEQQQTKNRKSAWT